MVVRPGDSFVGMPVPHGDRYVYSFLTTCCFLLLYSRKKEERKPSHLGVADLCREAGKCGAERGNYRTRVPSNRLAGTSLMLVKMIKGECDTFQRLTKKLI